MSSTTAEVVLYFQEDDPKFVDAVNAMRFIANPPLVFEEVRKILAPIWSVAYDKGYEDGLDDGTY